MLKYIYIYVIHLYYTYIYIYILHLLYIPLQCYKTSTSTCLVQATIFRVFRHVAVKYSRMMIPFSSTGNVVLGFKSALSVLL